VRLKQGFVYDNKLTSASSWKSVFEEIEGKTGDLLILQGEFATAWEKEHPSDFEVGTTVGSPNSVWVLKGPEEFSAVPA
jgi:hypothetical protein